MSDHIIYSVIHYSGSLKQPLLQSTIDRNLRCIDNILKSRLLDRFLERISDSVFSAICDFSSIESEEDILEVVFDKVKPWADIVGAPPHSIIDALSLMTRDVECYPYFKFEFNGESAKSDDVMVSESINSVSPFVAKALNALDLGFTFTVLDLHGSKGYRTIYEYSSNSLAASTVSDLDEVYFKLSLIP